MTITPLKFWSLQFSSNILMMYAHKGAACEQSSPLLHGGNKTADNIKHEPQPLEYNERLLTQT
jgi:hypothetical protein